MRNGATFRADLSAMILAVLEKKGELHAYSIMQEINGYVGGEVAFRLASAYGLLPEMEEAGEIERLDPIIVGRSRLRVPYRISEKGRCTLRKRKEEWKKFKLIGEQLFGEA